jgi:hypothetical protein
LADAESPPEKSELRGAFSATTRYAQLQSTSLCSVFTGTTRPTEGNEAVMHSTTTASRECALARPVEARRQEDTIDTYVWTDEYDFLRSLYDSADNTSPKFRFPDLISACVSLVFRDDNAAELIFDYLRSELVLRNPDTTRRREAMWKAQYNLLLGLQRSRGNKHPYPQFQLDQFTTACVALVRLAGDAQRRIFDQARKNTAERAGRKEPLPDAG